MSRYIDTDKLYDKVEQLYKVSSGVVHANYRQILDVICDSDTEDVREVVRCKNCKFFEQFDKVEDFDGQCVVRDCETDKEEFCSYGRKRGEDPMRKCIIRNMVVHYRKSLISEYPIIDYDLTNREIIYLIRNCLDALEKENLTDGFLKCKISSNDKFAQVCFEFDSRDIEPKDEGTK